MVCILHHISSTRVYLESYPEETSALYETASEEEKSAIRSVGSARRQREILLTRGLLRKVFGERARLCHDQNGRPFVPGADCHISISHCPDQVALAVNSHSPVGIDLEVWREQILRVRKRFLSPLEIDKYDTNRLLLRAWTMKEALYKAAFTPGMTLSEGIRLPLEKTDGNIAEVLTSSGKKSFRLFELLPGLPNRSLALAVPL